MSRWKVEEVILVSQRGTGITIKETAREDQRKWSKKAGGATTTRTARANRRRTSTVRKQSRRGGHIVPTHIRLQVRQWGPGPDP